MNDPFEMPGPPAGSRGKAWWWLVPLAAAGAALALIFYPKAPAPEPPAPELPSPYEQPPAPPATTLPPAAPAVRHPIEEVRPAAATPATGPLPALDDSDAAVGAALAGFLDQTAIERHLVRSGFIRRVVATVDNLTRNEAPLRLWPVTPTSGRCLTIGSADVVQLSPENARRYAPALALMEAADTGKAVAQYQRFYPLFQEAYRELGYPDGHFNDRLVQVIDHLLATPAVTGPVLLRRHALIFKFADPDLESRSVGQKALLRMGSDNAARVKAKLRELRRQLTRQPPPAQP